jgi:hypothetical protein
MHVLAMNIKVGKIRYKTVHPGPLGSGLYRRLSRHGGAKDIPCPRYLGFRSVCHNEEIARLELGLISYNIIFVDPCAEQGGA